MHIMPDPPPTPEDSPQQAEEPIPAAKPAGGRDASLRLFVAIALPEEIHASLEKLTDDLKTGLKFTPCRPTWVRNETIHLTLAFLGRQPASQVEPIREALTAAVAGFAPLRLKIGGLDVFPHWRRPRVLWIGARDLTGQLRDLHAALHDRLAGFDYAPDDKAFRPHLTLARFKSMRGVHAAESIVKQHQPRRFGPFLAEHVTLYRSELHPEGAIHTPLHPVPIGKAPEGGEQAPGDEGEAQGRV